MTIDMLRARSLAAPVAAVALSAWLGVSNHCTLGAVAPEKTPAQVHCCPFHSQPATPRPSKQSDAQPCCKILRAVLTKGVKGWAPENVDLGDIGSAFAEFVVFASPRVSASANALDTGPPGVLSFAELVLQRSTRAHAPPSLG